ncbi:MAG: hypothetical protein ACKERG_00485 [Candidatus Hodgkinia cicadicola]
MLSCCQYFSSRRWAAASVLAVCALLKSLFCKGRNLKQADILRLFRRRVAGGGCV